MRRINRERDNLEKLRPMRFCFALAMPTGSRNFLGHRPNAGFPSPLRVEERRVRSRDLFGWKQSLSPDNSTLLPEIVTTGRAASAAIRKGLWLPGKVARGRPLVVSVAGLARAGKA